MRLFFVILLFPVFSFAQANLDSLVSMPYDVMVSDLPLSKSRLESGLETATAQQDSLSTARIHTMLSTVMVLMGDYEASLQHGINAIHLYEGLNEYAKAGGIYCGIGYQIKRRDLDKGIEYMRRGLSLLEQYPDSMELEAGNSNFGVLKEMKGELDSAKFYYNRAYAISLAQKDSIAIPYSLHHLGGVELMQKNYDEAKRLFDEGLLIRTLRNDRNGMAESHIFLGEYFKEVGSVDSATYHFNKAILLSYEVGIPYMRQYCYDQMAQMYENAGQEKEALLMYKKYDAVKDSLLQKQRTEQLAEMETRFETSQKEKENLVLKQEKQEQQLVVSRQRNWIFGLVGAALVILFLALFVLQRNKRIAEAKRDAAIIEERERGLRSIIQATEDERKRIAKDLHDGIVQSLTGLSLRMQKQSNSEKAKTSGLNEEINSTRSILDESIAEVRGISHQMMPRVLSEMGLIPALDDMLQKSLGQTKIEYEFEHHNIDEQRFPESIEVSLYRICQELINNIIKHSEAKAVSVQLLKTRSHLVLVVEDNGKGFNFQDKSNQNGIGLMNITSRTKAMHGEVNYEPSPQQGTVATIRIPIT